MQITSNTTPHPADLFVFTDKQGQKHCVVVVKASFSVDAAGVCVPSAEQVPLVYTDDHFGDPGETAIRFESEFVPFKPRVDVLLHAEAVAGEGRSVEALNVAWAGPGLAKSAVVIGDRVWERRLMGVAASAPQPFETMPLAWHRAFGGSDVSHARHEKHGHDLRNLVGRGFHVNDEPASIVGRPLPNTERPEALLQDPFDRPEPIGFGPLGRGWQPRIGFAGTYDQRWMDEDLPFLPQDFDMRYFQSAPLDQQWDAVPAGSVFRCLHMNASGRFSVQVPAWAVPVRFAFDDRTVSHTIEADTLIVEPGVGRLVMTGRASVPLPRKAASLREIEVGKSKPFVTAPAKRHYPSLGAAVAALRKSARRP